MIRPFRSFLYPLFQDPIVPADLPAPAPAPVPSQLTCEFCDCILARNGQVLRVGARAKKLRDAEDDIAGRDSTIRERETEIATLKTRVAELEAQIPKPRPKDRGLGG